MCNEEWLPLRISLETGLRIGDVVSLKRGALKRKDGKFLLRTTAQKTGKIGDFPISDALAEVLKVRKGTFIFPSYGKSGHLTRQAAWSRMKTAAHRLGINADGISPHSLRKCFAVALRHQAGIETDTRHCVGAHGQCQ
jgi:integrase/recombinase XerD